MNVNFAKKPFYAKNVPIMLEKTLTLTKYKHISDFLFYNNNI